MGREQEQPQAPSPAAPEAYADRAAGLFALIEAEFGARLDEAGRARVRERIEQQRSAIEQLSAASAALANGDEPDFVFSVYRGR